MKGEFETGVSYYTFGTAHIKNQFSRNSNLLPMVSVLPGRRKPEAVLVPAYK